ncbi:hypothetical protein DIPPA_54832, partial [Diplonema papillatum]
MAPGPGLASPVLTSFLVLACARHCAADSSRWASPVRTGNVQCGGAAAAGSDVYVAHTSGLERFDCTNPWNCQSVVWLPTMMGYTREIALSGEYVYLANSVGIDLQHASNLTSIEMVMYLECGSIAVGESHVFATCTDVNDAFACLYVYEKPLKHVATGYCWGATPTTVFFEKTTSMVYVGTDNGVQVFDALDPANLVQRDVFCAGYTVTDIGADANHTWVATNQGLRKFRHDGSGNQTFMVEMQLPTNSVLALWEPLEHLFYSNFSEFGAFGTVSSDLIESYEIPDTNPWIPDVHMAVGESGSGLFVAICSHEAINVFMHIPETEAPETGSPPTNVPSVSRATPAPPAPPTPATNVPSVSRATPAPPAPPTPAT